MKYSEMETSELVRWLRSATSVSHDAATGQKWVWAGHIDHEEPGDGTAICRELVRRGVLLSDDPEDGYHVFEVSESPYKGNIN